MNEKNGSSFPERFENIKYKRLGKTGFDVSICGFGSYRIDYRVKEHSEALEYAIGKGINLIDTSANYSDGGSEILIGKVVKKLISEKKISRNDISIVTKGGYIQGQNYELAKQKENSRKPYHDIVKCTPGLWHCIHPDFLSDQLSFSLKRMEINFADVYLLHNPEYFLTYSAVSDINELRKEYYSRIRKAFTFLEDEAAEGRILYYGVSSNTFGEDDSKRNFTSLETLISIANEISPNNHFAVIQLPLNLIEKGGAGIKNQANKTKSVLELAHENNIGVLINRPLNAINGNKITRLADFPVKENITVDEISPLINQMNKSEIEIREELIERMNLERNFKRELIDAITLSELLKSAHKEFTSASLFIEARKQYFVPRTSYAVNEIFKYYANAAGITEKLNNFITLVNIVLNSIESVLAKKSNEKNISFHNEINKYLDDNEKNLPLSQKAVLMINSLPEVNCTLVGMRTIQYVDDIVESMQYPFAANVHEYWKVE